MSSTMRDKHSPIKYNLLASFGYAMSGILHALTHERNLRIHFAAAGYVLYFSRYYDLTRRDYCVILMLLGMVVTSEMFNTAIENTVDLETSAYNSLAKTAKDVAAGAVLVSAAISVAAGLLMFWDLEVFATIWGAILTRPLLWLILAVVTILWIALPQERPRKNIRRKQ